MSTHNLLRVILVLGVIADSSFITFPQNAFSGLRLAQTDSWPTFLHDPSHSGFTNGSAPQLPRLLWTFSTGDRISASPLINNGLVFVQSYDGYLYALNQSTGIMHWRTKIGFAGFSTPTIYGDSVYAVGNTSLYRVSAISGQRIWNITLTRMDDMSPLAVNGMIYTSGSGYLYGVDAGNGAIIWNSTGGYGEPTYAYGLVFIGHATSIEAHNATNGKLDWSFDTGDTPLGFSVSKGVLYGGERILYALNASTGSLVWQTNYPGGLGGAPTIAYNKIFLNVGPGISAVDQATGRGLWGFVFKGLGNSFSFPAVADGLVFSGGGANNIPDPTIYALNESNGKIVWSYPVTGGADSSPAISDGILYVGDDAGKLYAIANVTSTSPGPMVPLEVLLGVLVFALVLVLAVASRLKRSRERIGKLTPQIGRNFCEGPTH